MLPPCPVVVPFCSLSIANNLLVPLTASSTHPYRTSPPTPTPRSTPPPKLLRGATPPHPRVPHNGNRLTTRCKPFYPSLQCKTARYTADSSSSRSQRTHAVRLGSTWLVPSRPTIASTTASTEDFKNCPGSLRVRIPTGNANNVNMPAVDQIQVTRLFRFILPAPSGVVLMLVDGRRRVKVILGLGRSGDLSVTCRALLLSRWPDREAAARLEKL
ncbi:hypothetical protein VTI74DRAFT_1380 [Chaetomium olivicolor]